MDAKRKILLGFIAAALVANVIAFKEVIFLNGPHYLRVDVLDIGQGDSIFIQTPALRNIIIDGGPDSSVLEKVAKRLPFWNKKLDMLVLTHPDADHVNGFIEILKKYKVDYIVWTGIDRSGANYQTWLSLLEKAKEKGSKVIISSPGTTITSGGARLAIIYPFEDVEDTFLKEANDSGIVSRLTYGQKSFLFTADVSSKVEQQLVDAGVTLTSDVLKVGHHGSKYSSAETFLQAAAPRVAVISVGGNNTYGHPTPEVLQRLQKFGITTLRTDQRGDITFLSDGNNIQLK